MSYPVPLLQHDKRHLGFAGVVDEQGRELTIAHLREVYLNILGTPLVKLIQHLGPEHDDVKEAFHARVHGVWTIERYNAPIEWYAAKLMDLPEAAVADINAVPAAIRAQALELLRRNHAVETSQFEESFENLFTTNGVNLLWIGITQSSVGSANTSGSAAGSNAIFNSTQSRIGVADGTTAAAAGDTDIQSSGSNKTWQVVSGAPSVSTNQIQFAASFGTSSANYAWNNFAVDNCGGSSATSSTRSGGTMLDHVVSSQGTKASGQTWNPTMTLSVS